MLLLPIDHLRCASGQRESLIARVGKERAQADQLRVDRIGRLFEIGRVNGLATPLTDQQGILGVAEIGGSAAQKHAILRIAALDQHLMIEADDPVTLLTHWNP